MALVNFFLFSCGTKTPNRNQEPTKQQSQVTKDKSCVAVAPNWYRAREMDSTHNLIKTGYGCGESLKLAKNKGLDNAARKLGVTISSERERRLQEVQSRKRQIEESYEVNTSIRATHRIKNFEIIRREQKSGFHYVVYKIDRRPLMYILVDDLIEKIGPPNIPLKRIEWKGPAVLTESQLVSELENRLVNRENGKQVVEMSIDLRREDNRWLLIVDHVLTTVDNPDFARLLNWKTQKEGDLQLDLISFDKGRNGNRLQVGDTFYFRVKTDRPNNKYYALFNIYADGRVCVLKQRTSMKSVRFVPSKKALDRGETFQAVPLEPGTPTLDVYLAVLSDRPFNTTRFLFLSKGKQMCSTDKSYQIDELLTWIDRNNIQATDALVAQSLPEP